MKNRNTYILNTVIFLLILLWVYASLSKLLEFNLFKSQVAKQELPGLIKRTIIYWLPPLELLIAVSLFFDRIRKIALYVSLLLMICFTVYVGLVYFHFFPKKPCSCGGAISALDWGGHLIFNTFFMLLTALGLYITYKERRSAQEFTGL